MKKRITALVCAAVLALGCVFAATGCSGKQVAATVKVGDGTAVEIYEDTITADVEAFRSSYGLEDEADWAEWMSTYGYTPETVRETMIDSYVETELIKAAAKENGVTVETSTIDNYVNQIKSNYDSDEAFTNALTSAGYTLESYRERVEEALLEQDLMDKVTPLTDPDDETLLTYAEMYASYYDGAKRSSHILFSADDTETAQKVLDQINAGTLDFAEAAKQYSQDSGSAADGGDVGWDVASSFVEEYTDALDSLEAGQVSGLVTSDYGIHIIKCTEVFNAPEEMTSLDQMPSSLLELISENVKSYAQQSDFSSWLSDYKENATIDIKDMPSNLSYNVDMTKYTNTENTNNTNNSSVTVVNTSNNEATNTNTNSNSN